ncbi:MAG: alpha/beta hydrolase [Saprospiraceae bacterium]|nr:MAG: alpha/beta hydrolase [Saprospiraceae bacterium]
MKSLPLTIEEYSWTGPKGLSICARHWVVEHPKAAVCLVHGLGEHCARYRQVAEYFAKRGIALSGFDLPGHGRSGGSRGHAFSTEVIFENIARLLKEVSAKYPGIPLFLYGQSMGGNLVLSYTLARRPTVSGVIATSSWIRLPEKPSPLLVAFGCMMRRVLPSFTQNSGLNPRYISRDDEVVRAYQSDSLVHNRISVETGLSLLEAAQKLDAFAGKVPVPVLLIHGSADQITDPAGSEGFAKRAKGDVTFKRWDSLYHETHNEPEKEVVLANMAGWIETHS